MKYKYLFLLILLISSEALPADNLGRLFMTPDQRAQLDTVRARRDPRQPVTPESEPVAAAPAAPVPQGPDTVTYNGVVRRSDGKSTVWINGKSIDERSRIRGAHEVNVVGMRSDGSVSVVIPQASRVASLKVGQNLDVNSGTIEESYARRATLIRPPTAAPAPATPPAATPTLLAPVASAAIPASWPVRESDTKKADY